MTQIGRSAIQTLALHNGGPVLTRLWSVLATAGMPGSTQIAGEEASLSRMQRSFLTVARRVDRCASARHSAQRGTSYSAQHQNTFFRARLHQGNARPSAAGVKCRGGAAPTRRPLLLDLRITTTVEGRLTLPISGPLRGGLVARTLQAGPEWRARGLRQGDRHIPPAARIV